jgi:hypothetical protein
MESDLAPVHNLTAQGLDFAKASRKHHSGRERVREKA